MERLDEEIEAVLRFMREGWSLLRLADGENEKFYLKQYREGGPKESVSLTVAKRVMETPGVEYAKQGRWHVWTIPVPDKYYSLEVQELVDDIRTRHKGITHVMQGKNSVAARQSLVTEISNIISRIMYESDERGNPLKEL